MNECAAAGELPRQERLIKLLALTTSPNDGEALAALRKANELLAAAGWSWERLIRGKIRVLEDPFKHIVEPTMRPAEQMKRPTTPPVYAAPPRYAPPSPPRVPRRYRTPKTTLADLGLDT